MSKESTVSTAWGCADVADASQGCLTANSHNKNGGNGKLEIGKVLHYPRNFFTWTTGGLPKDEEAVCCLWPYRKARPKKGSGSADMVSADGEQC